MLWHPFFLLACAKKESSQSKDTTKAKEDRVITVATYTKPSSTFLELVEDNVKEKGYTLKIETISDYI